mmetsp:Transcript_15660/g.27320  ORF Transcript_15660/g.27320 Transcript_15660/m.27320 type:complete len:475 (+) Transcript_15660:274-1698(+)|eukprot:CAMPEP_0203765512 /NCGR_PEP_ID=MMETSP0098-20131031/18451_1 /ASSEMBLY_ACC=CAM_ASM_000208 /TAXON_ID=96639 /ORGANISM=" , Strain NY0313808BC1" /LENGTH=474 /DNA_ID=CAMNT_0050661771 /DNA_START=138 /DNA_END=1562 /DNA_ORIENTATION=-
MDGLGVHKYWGMSPAVDLLQAYRELCQGGDVQGGGEELKILVLGAGDIGHAIKTAAACRRENKNTKVKIYMYDSPVECLARHLGLLAILTDWQVPVRLRANTFLEVFGNCLVQERTSKYIGELGEKLVKFVCNDEGTLRRLVDLSLLKHRDADALEKIFKSWGDNVAFDMKTLRDDRLRALHKERYDNRVGLVDWDYQSGVKPTASIIHSQQYRKWRDTGVAFEFGDQTYTMSNRTMASYAEGKANGKSQLRRGFWSDVVVGPYASFGISCDQPNQHAKDLFQIQSKGTATEQHRHTAVHVSVYNILSYLHEIETGKVYQMTKAHDIFSGLDKTNMSCTPEADTQQCDPTQHPQHEFAMDCAKNIMEMKDYITIVLMTGQKFDATFDKPKFNNHFDMIWVSNQHAHLVADPVFSKLIQKGKPILLETARNMAMLKLEQKKEFVKKLRVLSGKIKAQESKRTKEQELPDYMAFTV